MSTLQVANVVSNGTVVSNTVTVSGPGLTINSTGLFVNSFPFINSSAITVGDSSTNNIIQPTISEPSITINNQVFTSLELVNVQIFTANGNWTKPSWAAAVGAANTSADLVIVHLWGAGGGGDSRGGGGGAFVYGIYMSTQVNSTANVTVGIGGTTNTVGGSSIFGNSSSFDGVNRTLTAYGGGNPSDTRGGGGGGWLSAGSNTSGGSPLGNTSSAGASTFGGGGGGTSSGGAGGVSIYGGGGGADSAGAGGNTIYGGGGGSRTGTVGTSVYGGFGGNSSVAATAPGGGGAGLTNTTGANGKVVVYTLRKIS